MTIKSSVSLREKARKKTETPLKRRRSSATAKVQNETPTKVAAAASNMANKIKKVEPIARVEQVKIREMIPGVKDEKDAMMPDEKDIVAFYGEAYNGTRAFLAEAHRRAIKMSSAHHDTFMGFDDGFSHAQAFRQLRSLEPSRRMQRER